MSLFDNWMFHIYKIPLHQRTPCAKLKLATLYVILEGKTFKFRRYIFAFLLSFPLGKGCDSLCEQNWRMLCVKCRWNLPRGFGEVDKKCEKFTDRRTDRRRAIKKAQVSFQPRWDKKAHICFKKSHIEICFLRYLLCTIYSITCTMRIFS